MGRFVRPPRPNEEKLTKVIVREIDLPHGRVMRISMSQWHWEMIEFLELWDAHYGRKHGIIYEFHKRMPNVLDEKFSNALMVLLREDYNQWVQEAPPGEEPKFPDPRENAP